jgi:hypothetical protein
MEDSLRFLCALCGSAVNLCHPSLFSLFLPSSLCQKIDRQRLSQTIASLGWMDAEADVEGHPMVILLVLIGDAQIPGLG